ncbi:MAG: Bax inhibitor-1/YccA family protein [Bacteroidales bacterium]|nr:Bax inhibitor-1/YccA family protein [Bacteroidales bacterium]MCF8406079.1 Bax inhibitor-1/YccA family protein [Bacteroidales bacterium]
MNISRSANPALNKNTFINAERVSSDGVMTIQGTVNKVFIMLFLVLLAASYTWKFMATQDLVALKTYMIGGAIGGFIVAIITVFKKTWAPYTAPIYAVLEGLFLGGISAVFEAQYPGIVMNAVALTFGTLFALLFAYKSGRIKVTENFKLGVVAATGGIAFVYLFSFIMGMFGVPLGFIHGNGILSIIISLVVVVVAALNLVLDFDFIESGAEAGAPKYMEWYGAFGLIVTLVWLYIEFLRLLSKISSRN